VTSLASFLGVETRCLVLSHPYVQEGMEVAEFQYAVVMEQATGDQGKGAHLKVRHQRENPWKDESGLQFIRVTGQREYRLD